MDRDFDKEKILDKMRELREQREIELLNKELENVNLDSDYQKELKKNKVLNVKYLGTVEIDGEPKGIYLLLEQKENDNKSIAQVERYYTEEGEFLGGNNDLDEYDFITLKEEYMDRDEILSQLQNLNKEGILDLNEIEQDRLEKIARELGIDERNIEKLAEIDGEREIEKDKEKKDDESKDKNNSGKEVSKKEIEKLSTKTEINTNQKVTDRDTISSLLGTQGKGYVKIAVVYSDKLQDNNNSTRFSFVGIKSDGSAEKIDTLEQAYGNNPTKNVQTVNRDGSKIEEDKVNSIFRIKGKDEEQFAVNIGPAGTIEAKFLRTPRQAGQEAISIPIETSSIRPTTREVRESINRSRDTNINDNIKRAKEHEKLGCKATIRDINDNKYDDTHEHIEIDEEYINKCVDIILKEDENASKYYNHADLRGKVKNYLEKNTNKEMRTEDLIENMKQQIETDVKAEHEPKGQQNDY